MLFVTYRIKWYTSKHVVKIVTGANFVEPDLVCFLWMMCLLYVSMYEVQRPTNKHDGPVNSKVKFTTRYLCNLNIWGIWLSPLNHDLCTLCMFVCRISVNRTCQSMSWTKPNPNRHLGAQNRPTWTKSPWSLIIQEKEAWTLNRKWLAVEKTFKLLCFSPASWLFLKYVNKINPWPGWHQASGFAMLFKTVDINQLKTRWDSFLHLCRRDGNRPTHTMNLHELSHRTFMWALRGPCQLIKGRRPLHPSPYVFFVSEISPVRTFPSSVKPGKISSCRDHQWAGSRYQIFPTARWHELDLPGKVMWCCYGNKEHHRYVKKVASGVQGGGV